MVQACDKNTRREMASHNSLLDPTRKKEEETTWAVMASHRQRKKGDEGRRCPGPDTLEKRIGKAADSRISRIGVLCRTSKSST
jgi:hypothetical protein